MRKSTEHAALSMLPHMYPKHICLQELLNMQFETLCGYSNYFTYALWFLTQTRLAKQFSATFTAIIEWQFLICLQFSAIAFP